MMDRPRHWREKPATRGVLASVSCGISVHWDDSTPWHDQVTCGNCLRRIDKLVREARK